jgi:hypothetical protein
MGPYQPSAEPFWAFTVVVGLAVISQLVVAYYHVGLIIIINKAY